MYIYAFGSVCRGEVDSGSDIDLLAIVTGYDERFDPNLYSIYSLDRLKEIWNQGNPFAWHLSLESKILFSDDGTDALKELGQPNKYTSGKEDCQKFYDIFKKSVNSIEASKESIVFDLSTIFLAIRNFATCFSLQMTENPDFSRNSARRLNLLSIDISETSYKIFERSRILCTRGYGKPIQKSEINIALESVKFIDNWMKKLTKLMDNK